MAESLSPGGDRRASWRREPPRALWKTAGGRPRIWQPGQKWGGRRADATGPVHRKVSQAEVPPQGSPGEEDTSSLPNVPPAPLQQKDGGSVLCSGFPLVLKATTTPREKVLLSFIILWRQQPRLRGDLPITSNSAVLGHYPRQLLTWPPCFTKGPPAPRSLQTEEGPSPVLITLLAAAL